MLNFEIFLIVLPEIIEGGRVANYALMLLCSIEGIDFAKVIQNTTGFFKILKAPPA